MVNEELKRSETEMKIKTIQNIIKIVLNVINYN